MAQAHTRSLLREAVQRAGLSYEDFARRVLLRQSRTLRRWLSGESPVPAPVVQWLEAGAPDLMARTRWRPAK